MLVVKFQCTSWGTNPQGTNPWGTNPRGYTELQQLLPTSDTTVSLYRNHVWNSFRLLLFCQAV